MNRVEVIEEGDSSFVSMELAWLSDIEKEVEQIRAGNERFSGGREDHGRKNCDVAGQGDIEPP